MLIGITVMLKEGGCQSVRTTSSLLGKIAESISEQGFEYVHLLSGTITVVGFLVTGKETGERVIILGKKGDIE